MKLFLWENRISLNLGFYESISRDETSANIRSGPQGDFGSRLNEIWSFLADASLGGAGEARFLNKPFRVLEWQDTLDRESEGVEASIVANPTPQWRLSLSASLQETLSANSGPYIRQYTTEMAAMLRRDYSSFLNVPFTPANRPTTSINNNLVTIEESIRSLDSLQGTEDSRQPTFGATLVVNYTFARESFLDGVGLGGAVRHRGSAVIGYEQFANGGFNPSRPFKGPEVTEGDLWFSYRRKLGRHVSWRVQLNVNNVLDEDDLRPLERINKGGAGIVTTRYFIPSGRRWLLTNAFEF